MHKPLNSGTSRSRVLSDEDIASSLLLYPPNQQFISSAELSNEGGLTCKASHFPHPFQTPEPLHLAREPATVYVTQALCVLVGCASKFGFRTSMDSSRFAAALLSEKALITQLSLHFKRYIQVADFYALHIWCDRYVSDRDKYIGTFSFELQTHCVGSLKAFADLRV